MSDLPLLLGATASVLVVIGLSLVAAGWGLLRRRRWSRGTASWLTGLVLVLCGVLGWAVVVGTRGYRALTREELAATVTTEPLGPKSFRAVVERPGARPDTFRIAGDQLYVDAHILKWHPWANLLGIHTAYQLTRVGGRYRSVGDERTEERSVYALSDDPAPEIFRVVDRVPVLGRAVDATYGSAAFVPAGRETAGAFEVRVTTSGLLIRSRDDSLTRPR